MLKRIVDPTVFSDPEFVKEDVLKWIHTHGPTWSWFEQLVREAVHNATGMKLESAAQVMRVPDEPNRQATGTEFELNDYATSTNDQERR